MDLMCWWWGMEPFSKPHLVPDIQVLLSHVQNSGNFILSFSLTLKFGRPNLRLPLTLKLLSRSAMVFSFSFPFSCCMTSLQVTEYESYKTRISCVQLLTTGRMFLMARQNKWKLEKKFKKFRIRGTANLNHEFLLRMTRNILENHQKYFEKYFNRFVRLLSLKSYYFGDTLLTIVRCQQTNAVEKEITTTEASEDRQ